MQLYIIIFNNYLAFISVENNLFTLLVLIFQIKIRIHFKYQFFSRYYYFTIKK